MDLTPLVPLWITSGATAIGVIYAIIRNGSRSRKKDDELKAELKTEVGAIKDKLDDPETGLTAIKKSVEDQRLYCVETSTRLGEKVKTNRRDIDSIREKKR